MGQILPQDLKQSFPYRKKHSFSCHSAEFNPFTRTLFAELLFHSSICVALVFSKIFVQQVSFLLLTADYTLLRKKKNKTKK